MICAASEGSPASPLGTLSHLLRQYAKHKDLQPDSIEQLEVSVRVFESYLGRCAGLADLERERLVEFLVAYAKQAGPSTVANKRRDLLALWSFAADEGFPVAPQRRVRPIRVPTKEPQGWDEIELRMILDALPRLTGKHANGIPRSVLCRALILTILATALRASAQLAVPFKDVRHDLSFTVRWRTQKTWCEQTKRLTPQAWDAILECRRYGSFSRLLPYETKTRVASETFTELVGLAGLDNSRGHSLQQLRRTAASFKEREQPGSAKQFLGHKTVGLAEKRYLVPRIVRPELIAPPTLRL